MCLTAEGAGIGDILTISSPALAFLLSTHFVIVFLLFPCQSFFLLLLFLCLQILLYSLSAPHLCGGGAAPPVKPVRVGVVDRIRMSPPRGMQQCQAGTKTKEDSGACINKPCTCTHIHTHTHLFHMLITIHHESSACPNRRWRDKERGRERRMRWAENEG